MINKFSSRPPVEVLQDIFHLKARKEKGEAIQMPLLTLMLPGKLPLSGFLIDFKKDTHNAYHLSLELEGSASVFFAETYFVQGVIVHNIESIDYLLTDLTDSNVSDKTIPTKLEIRTFAANESKRLSEYFSKGIEVSYDEEGISSKHFFFLKQILADCVMSLIFIGEEEPGKSAIAESIDKLLVRHGDEVSIKLIEKTLTVTHPLTHSYSTRQKRAVLQETIVQIL